MKKKKFLIITFSAVLLIVAVLLIFSRPHNLGLYKVTVLPSLGRNSTYPQSINDKGQIAGFSEVSGGTYNLFIWDKENGIRDLGPVEQRDISINNAGQIAASMNRSKRQQSSFCLGPEFRENNPSYSWGQELLCAEALTISAR